MERHESEKVSEIDQSSVSSNERSTINFPYSDLDNAAEVARGVHDVGGTACTSEQLAARFGQEAKGGGFRQRVNGATVYDVITYERGGRISITELGRRLIDPQQERAARRDAFLRVPLYAKVFEDYKGRPLPPQTALERAIIGMGVGTKVADKARQVLMRSAKQAGFFELSPDRLTEPPIREGERRSVAEPESDKHALKHTGTGSNGGNGGGDEMNLDPLLLALLRKIPNRGEKWPVDKRLRWFRTFAMNVSQVYDEDEDNPVEMRIEAKGGVAVKTADDLV